MEEIFLRSWNGRSTRYCQTDEKEIFQHLQSPRSTWLICCQTTFAVHGLPFKLVFSVLHTIPFKLPPSLSRCIAALDFNCMWLYFAWKWFWRETFCMIQEFGKGAKQSRTPYDWWNVLKVTSSTWKCWHIETGRKKKKM